MSIQLTQTTPHSRNLPTARNGWFCRLQAKLMAKRAPAYNQMVGDRKYILLGNLTGTVLEIGPGTGTNLPFYRSDIHWIGVEPSLAMHPYLTEQAAKARLTGELRTGIAEALDVADNYVDAVVSTLVLCSVEDQHQALAEIKRVLKPGGKFVFIEHVAAPEGTSTRRWQEWLTPVSKAVADGCHPNRETWKAIAQAGFTQVEIEHFALPVALEGPHIAGFAVK
jgi:ubiquinone/menaquinone biosynthesis C-methylase UbiE